MANPFSTFTGPDGTEHEVKDAAAREAIGALETKSEATNVAYGTCATAAGTAAKVIAITGNTKWKLAAGSIIMVKFSATNTAQNPTFNVNNTGAKSVWYDTALITTGSLSYAGYAGRAAAYVYDGTQYVFMGWSVDSNTTYTNASLGQGYGTCSTAAATAAKAVTLSSYSLVVGGIVAVKFTYAVPAGATLNINGKGAKAIYYKGAAITADVIKAGDIGVFVYDGSQYHLFAIDIAAGTTPVERGGTGNTSVDTTPTSGSTKMVTSGGVYAALGKKANLTGAAFTGSVSIKQADATLSLYNSDGSKTALFKMFSSGTVQIFGSDSDYASNIVQIMLKPADVVSSLKYAFQFGFGKDTYYPVFGTHNKPAGSYAGNGSATARTIDTGGLGYLAIITSSNGHGIVSSAGGTFWGKGQSAASTHFASSVIKMSDGVITIAGTDAFFNGSSVTYGYRVL